MAVLRALADATPLSILVAIVAFVVADASGEVSPVAIGLLAGVAVLVGGVGVSLVFQTEERRYPLTRVTFELLALD